MNLCQRIGRGLLMTGGGNEPPVPAGYTPLKYLQSNGHQYIDPNIYSKSDSIFKTKSLVKRTSWYNTSFGGLSGRAGSNYDGCVYNLFNPGIEFGLNGYNHNIGSSALYNREYEFEFNIPERYVSIDGIIKMTTDQVFTISKKMLLFALGTDDGYYVGTEFIGNVYYLTEENSGQITNNLVPVLRHTDNKPGMFNLITNEFHTNQINWHEFGYEKLDGTYVAPT